MEKIERKPGTKVPKEATGEKITASEIGERENENCFPVMGIGASPGGLEALDKSFRKMPIRSGMAFLILQHLDPTHKSILAELLRSSTRMREPSFKRHCEG